MAPLLPTTHSTSLVSMLSHLLHASSTWRTTATPSSSTHLGRSAMSGVVDPAVLPLVSNGTCYQANNVELDDHFIPCGNVMFGDHACCQAGDVCLESSACYNNDLNMIYIAGCTDKAYANETVCPSKGPWEDSAAWLGVTHVGNDTWATCPPDDAPKPHLLEGTTVPCDHKNADHESAVFKAGKTLKTVAHLPDALFGLISISTSVPRSASAQIVQDDDNSMTSKDGDMNGEEPFHGNPDILVVLLLLTFFLFVLPVATMFWRVFIVSKVFGTPVQRDRRRPPVRSFVEPGRGHFSRPPAPPRRISLYSLGSLGSMTSLDGVTITNSPPPTGCELASPQRARSVVRFADDVESEPAERSPTQESMSSAASNSGPSMTKKLVKSETSRTFTWKGLCRKPAGTTASLPL